MYHKLQKQKEILNTKKQLMKYNPISHKSNIFSGLKKAGLVTYNNFSHFLSFHILFTFNHLNMCHWWDLH